VSIRVVRLGDPRIGGEGPRLGTVRRVPRGAKQQDYARLNYFDVWLPELAPSTDLLAWAKISSLTPSRWHSFTRRYRAEMSQGTARHLLVTLAVLSAEANFSVGCYCPDESRCHRTLLRDLLVEAGAVVEDENPGG
jgi:uncharacterized protein YeaO (DUF488 family)